MYRKKNLPIRGLDWTAPSLSVVPEPKLHIHNTATNQLQPFLSNTSPKGSRGSRNKHLYPLTLLPFSLLADNIDQVHCGPLVSSSLDSVITLPKWQYMIWVH
jgi:hypothetical protein